LCGAALTADLLEVPEFEAGDIRIRGFIGKAGVSRSTRQQQLIFLNGRPVENSTVNYAVREGYHTALMKGQHPVTFLFIDMDPAAVDVNVHPAKREVRFREAATVRDAVVEAIRRGLESDRGAWSQTFRAAPEVSGSTFLVSGSPNRGVPETSALIPESEQVALRRDWSALPIQPAKPETSTDLGPSPSDVAFQPETRNQKPETTARDFRILGVLGKLYVLMENASGLVLVDQHAAHERILFEEMRKRMEAQGVPAQRLLMPLTLQVTPRDADWIMRNVDTLQRAGIGLEPFGAATFKIDTLPTFIRSTDPSQLLREIIDDLRETSAQTSKLRLGEDMIAKTVCRHAVKANDVLREPELVRLIQDLLACDLPYCCPHGRPTMIQLSYSELEKKFGRKV
jgi:DNA mismatch repair protein MutL